jgi:hypothetical protein
MLAPAEATDSVVLGEVEAPVVLMPIVPSPQLVKSRLVATIIMGRICFFIIMMFNSSVLL